MLTGELGVAIAVIERWREELRLRTLKLIDSGALNDRQRRRLWKALRELEAALEAIKKERGIALPARANEVGRDGGGDETVNKMATRMQF